MYVKLNSNRLVNISGKWSKDSKGKLTVIFDRHHDHHELECDTTEKGSCEDYLAFQSNFSRENPPLVVIFESKDKDGNEINFTWTWTDKPKPKTDDGKYLYIGLALIATIVRLFL